MGDSNMRIRQMDGLRAVAALAVVMIHVSAGRMNPVGVSCNQTARFAVPLFIMLSGYGHMHSWLQHSGQSAVQTAKRRLKRVLPAYLVWSVLYLAVDAVFGKPHAHPIKNILTGGSYVHLYYIFILVQLILLSELFCRAVERHPAVTLLLSAGLTFGMEIVLYLLTVGQLQWQFPVAPIGLFVCWPLFYNIGAWLAKSGLSDRLRLRVCLPLWALSAVLVLLAEEHSAAAYKMGLRPDTTVYTLLTWAVLWSLFSRLPEDSEAAAVYRAAFVRTVSGTSAGAAPVERVGGTADTGYLSAPVADVCAGACRRTGDCGHTVLSAVRRVSGRRKTYKEILQRRA